MKKLLLILITIGLAYFTAFYTTGKKKGYPSPLDFSWIDSIDFDIEDYEDISYDEDVIEDSLLQDIPEDIKGNQSMVSGYKAFLGEDYSAALGFFKHALQDPEMEAKANLMIARSYIKRGNASSAGHYLDEAVGNAPRDPEAYYYRGKWKYNNKQYQGAVEDLYMASELGIVETDAYYYLSMAYENNDNIAGALQAALISIEKDSTYLNGIFQAGRMYFRAKEYQKSADMYSYYLIIEPDEKYSTMNRALCYDYLKKLDSALIGYNRAIEIDSSYALAYNNRGYFHYERGDFDKALKDYAKALALKSDFERPLWNRASLLFKQKKFSEAAKDYIHLYKIDAANTSALYNIALCYDNNGEIDRAKRYYNLYLQSDAEDKTLTEAARKKIEN